VIKPNTTNFFWWLRKLASSKGLILESISRSTEVDEFLESLRPIKIKTHLIRVGSQGDGGYLIPNDLEGIGGMFSPGVADNSDFEEQIAERGIECYLADGSVEEPPSKNKKFHFLKKFIGVNDNESSISLEKWIHQENPPKGDLILQMDIEGHEWPVILQTPSEVMQRFRIMVIEFHRFDLLLQKELFEIYKCTFEKIMTDFIIVHLHVNNFGFPAQYKERMIPPLVEVTFLRRDRVDHIEGHAEIPHPLDVTNTASWPASEMTTSTWFSRR
jgi:hypothetical protein